MPASFLKDAAGGKQAAIAQIDLQLYITLQRSRMLAPKVDAVPPA
jgi:hypothetical protein